MLNLPTPAELQAALDLLFSFPGWMTWKFSLSLSIQFDQLVFWILILTSSGFRSTHSSFLLCLPSVSDIENCFLHEKCKRVCGGGVGGQAAFLG